MSNSIVVQTAAGLRGHQSDDGQVRVLDLDVATVLGYARPRDIRKLIRRIIEEGLLSGIHTRATVARVERKGRGAVDIEATEYLLTIRESLFIAAKSETKEANAGTLRLIDEYLALQKLVGELIVSQAGVIGIAKGMLERLLRPTPEAWRECFEEEFIADICKLYRQPYAGRRDELGKPIPDPRFLGSVQKKIYKTVVGSAAYLEMKKRADEANVRLHQTLQSDPNAYFRDQLKIVHAIVRQSQNSADFWHRMLRQYRGGGLQLLLTEPEAERLPQ